MTAQEVIERGMRLLGVLPAGETPTTAELTDGLEVLNSMMAYWGAQRWVPTYLVQDSKVLTAADGTYTIGSGQDIDTVLPTRIVNAWIRDTEGFDSPLEIISQAEYAAIFDKDLSAEPEKLCFVKSGTTGTIYLYPVPDAADTLYIESQKRLGNYALSDSLGLPTEYELPVCYNFAVEYSLEFQQEASQALAQRAHETLSQIKIMNSQPVPRISTDSIGLGSGGYNIYTDN